MSEKNNDKISELKEQINTINITDDLIKIAGLKRIECLEEVLRDHLNSHIKVAREQLTEKDKMTVFREFDDAIVNQLKKLDVKDGDSEALKEIKKLAKEESEFYNKHGYFSFWSDKLKAQRIKEQNDGEKSTPSKCEFLNNDKCTKKEPCNVPFDKLEEICRKEPTEADRQTEEKPPKIIEAKPQKVWYNKKQVKPPEPKYIPKFTDITSDVVGNDMDTEEAFNYGKDLEKDYKIVEKADLTQINADLWWACGTILEVLKDKTYRDGTKHQAKQMRERWDKKIKKLLGGDLNNK